MNGALPAENIETRPAEKSEFKTDAAAKPAGPPPLATRVIRIENSTGWATLWPRDLWQYRELLYFLVWRDIKVRYKQTAIGASWAILQPLVSMMIISVVFGYIAKIPSDGAPYPLFVYTALLPWSYFSSALGRSSNCLIADSNLIQKVYFPRLILPVASASSPFVDFFFGFLVLLGMMFWFGAGFTWRLLTLPLFLLLAMITALSVALWLAPVNARFRDINLTIPLLIQLWMYASPVVYPVHLVPEKLQLFYSLNPMVGVIEGFRWALLGASAPGPMVTISLLATIAFLIGGMVYFLKKEKTLADVV